MQLDDSRWLEGAAEERGRTRSRVRRTSHPVATDRITMRAFGDHDVPSTLFGVTVLGYDEQLVEIEAIAAVVDQAVD